MNNLKAIKTINNILNNIKNEESLDLTNLSQILNEVVIILKNTGWNSVKNGLPREDGLYLIVYDGEVTAAWLNSFEGKKVWRMEEFGFEIFNSKLITHWAYPPTYDI